MTSNLIDLIDIDIKDIDSCMRCHNLGNLQLNRIFDYFCEVLHYGIKKENVQQIT